MKRKLFSSLLALALVLGICAPSAFAEDTLTLTLRIEGVRENLFYKTVEVPVADAATLQAALTYIDAQEDTLTLTGVDTAYITDINGEAAAQFGGWDGWMYRVNGAEPPVGIDGFALTDGDSVVLYYGDPYGVGMQYPVADTSALASGKLKFTSTDTTYDAAGTPSTAENPVTGATVTWLSGDVSTEYTTDENGEITLDTSLLTEGAHALQIAKVSDTGIPLVLRFAPDYTVEVAAPAETAAPAEDTATPETGAGTPSVTVVIAFALIAAAAVGVKSKRSNG